MAGVNSLHDIYAERGKDFINELIEKFVIINEQINGSFFGILKKDGEAQFLKKSGPITYIDRILMKYYDKAIKHFESIDKSALDSIPEGYMIGMQYICTSGDDAPLIFMSHIHDTVNEQHIHTKAELDKWANTLQVKPPPILYEGTLTQDQKNELMEFVLTPREDLTERFKTESFTEYLLGLLGAEPLKHRSVNGVVFRFYENNEVKAHKAVLAKIIDPMIAEMESEKPKDKPSDFVYLILLDLMNHIEGMSVTSLRNSVDKQKTFEENYMSMMDTVYLDFIEENKFKYLDIRIDIPEFLKRDEFDLNVDMIANEQVRDIVGMHGTFKEIYKILVNFFRKRRKRPSGMFNKDMNENFNDLVEKLRRIVVGVKVYETYMPSFYEYIGSVSEEFEGWAGLTFKEKYDKQRKLKRVNILIDSFQPFSLEHVQAAELMMRKNNLPTVLVVLHNNVKNSRHPLKHKLVKKLNDIAKANHTNLILDAVYINDSHIESIVNALHPTYQPVLFGTNKSHMNDYTLQLDYASRKSISYNLDKNFKLVQVPVGVTSGQILDAIHGNRMSEYKKLMPRYLYSEFFNIQREIAEFRK